MKRPDITTVHQLIARFEALPDRQTLRTYDLIAHLATTISKTTGRGYDLDDIVAILGDSGIQLARSTVRSYMSRARAANAASPPLPQLRKLSTARDGDPARATRQQDAPLSSPPEPNPRVPKTPQPHHDGAATPASDQGETIPAESSAPGKFQLIPDLPKL